jgi:hypothetical protein
MSKVLRILTFVAFIRLMSVTICPCPHAIYITKGLTDIFRISEYEPVENILPTCLYIIFNILSVLFNTLTQNLFILNQKRVIFRKRADFMSTRVAILQKILTALLSLFTLRKI